MAHRRAHASRISLLLACAAGLVAAPVAATATPAAAPATALAPMSTSTTITTAGDLSGGVTHEENDRVPEGASWTEHYFPSSDGSDVELHADVLRPAHLPEDARTPIILSVGPYFSHLGQANNERHAQTGPSVRFHDLIEGADLMARGYTVVYVDLRGFGASTGCLDWGGPGEQADVVAAVEWAAGQPWSNGKVGMYGKSYDAVTGLLGTIHEPEGLEAVVAQEPLWDMYNYLYSNWVMRPNATGTPGAYNGIATLRPMADDTDRYKANARYEQSHPECLTENSANGLIDDPADPYWRDRDLAELVTGSQVPLFIAQGTLEPNTKPEDMQQFLDNHEGEQRGWIGPWDHVRGNERNAAGQLLMGREGWFEEVMSFYDEHLLDVEPAVDYPRFAVQDNVGVWRAEDTWPVVDTTTSVKLESGTYLDDGAGMAYPYRPVTTSEREDGAVARSGEPAEELPTFDMENAPQFPEHAMGKKTGPKPRISEDDDSYYTWSRPVDKETRITGTPVLDFTVDAPGNTLVRFWDVAPDGTAVMFDEQITEVLPGDVSLALKDTDWTLEVGHQLVVSIGTDTTFFYTWWDVPTFEEITVTDARLTLELQNTRHDQIIQGDASPWLARYRAAYTTTIEELLPGTFSLNVNQGKGNG